ncbi:hypothetical protein M422DRAFT_159469 [Sphaerobolus stellatus SS14]|nr:hypothetical protein M422DRAFT_159469 [Sphaerobolus stellatus SS14]
MASRQRKPLPSKEQSLFKELLTQYENRTLKRAIKTADQILKKVPDHGETLCMKGLVLSHMNRKEEGLELVKKGLVFDMQSHICWHVLGIIKKADKNWEEALKAYTQAVRCDKENMNLLRDTAQLQVHLGLYENLKETRWQILKLRPNMRQNWVGYAVACHLSGNLDDARNALRTYLGTLKNVTNQDPEHSEVLLYYIRVLEDLGEYAEALEQLELHAKERAIVDKTATAEYRGRLLAKLSRTEEAAKTWRALIEQNPECYDYYRQFLALRGIELDFLTTDTRTTALSIFNDLISELPRSMAPRRLALKISEGSSEEFKALVLPYLINGFVKGIPSLFVDIRPLYADEAKRKAIEEIVEDFKTKAENDKNDALADPTVYIWILYFLALHYSTLPLSHDAPQPDLARASELIDKAIEHTPTLPELFMGKAKILKRAGDPFGGATAMEEARSLDGQDRFLNWKAARYLMRAGDIEGGLKLLGLFTKKDAPSPGSDLIDMQCLTYMLEEGNAHFREGRLGHALRKYKAVQETFNDIENDQFDFHNYTLRRYSVNIYLNLLSFEKQLRSHPAYVTAAVSSAKIYIQLNDNPSLLSGSEGDLYSGKLSDAEKKAKKKAKKAAQKVQEDAKKASAAVTKEDDIPEPPKDEDPEGKKLLETADLLGDAEAWLRPLEGLEIDRLDVLLVQYDVAVRRKKFLRALKALGNARKLAASSPEVHVRIVDYHLSAYIASVPQEDAASAVLKSSLESLVPADMSLETFNNEFLQNGSGSGAVLFAAACVSHLLESPIDTIESLIFGMLDGSNHTGVQLALDAHDFLKRIGSKRTDEFRQAAAARFPLSTIFYSSDQLESLRSQLHKPVTENGEAHTLDS